MTHTHTYYTLMHKTQFSTLGRPGHPTIDAAINEANYQCNRARELGYHNNEQWLIVKVTVATIRDNNDVFVSRTTDEKTIGLYDNGKVTMY